MNTPDLKTSVEDKRAQEPSRLERFRQRVVKRRLIAPWLGTKTFIALMALSVLLVVGAMAFLLRENLSFAPLSVSLSPPHLDASIAEAQEILKGNPEDLRALTRLGILYFQKGPESYPQAINELEDARSLGALDPRIFYYLGLMYQNLGFYPFAIEQYQRYLRNFPQDKDIREREAKLLYQAGRYAEASSEYQRLNFSFSKDPVIEENLGLSLWKLKDSDRAADIFRKLEASAPQTAKRDQFYLGEIAFDKKDYEKALGHFLKSVPAQGEDVGISAHDLYFPLATSFQKLGDYARSEKAWEEVLTADSHDLKAKIALRQVRRLLAIRRRNENRLRRKKLRKSQ